MFDVTTFDWVIFMIHDLFILTSRDFTRSKSSSVNMPADWLSNKIVLFDFHLMAI